MQRPQFDRPIAGFQLTQKKLADMTVAVGNGMLLAIHLGRLHEAGVLRGEQVSIGKLNNTRMALAVARTARSILGPTVHVGLSGDPPYEQPRIGGHL